MLCISNTDVRDMHVVLISMIITMRIRFDRKRDRVYSSTPQCTLHTSHVTFWFSEYDCRRVCVVKCVRYIRGGLCTGLSRASIKPNTE